MKKAAFEDKPLVSIITPVINGEKYIEQTIKSVINQDYDNIEYIIIDGGSKDKTIDIINKYEKHIDFWVSEPDKCQADAINKGFSIAKGDILVWLNYDDLYFSHTVEDIVCALRSKKASFTFGHCQLIDANNVIFKTLYTCNQTFKSYQIDNGNIFQGTVFFTKELWKQYGPLETSLKCSFEYRLFDEFFKSEKGIFINKILAMYRIHDESISANYKELFKVECAIFRDCNNCALKRFYYKLRRICLNTKDGNLISKIREGVRCKNKRTK